MAVFARTENFMRKKLFCYLSAFLLPLLSACLLTGCGSFTENNGISADRTEDAEQYDSVEASSVPSDPACENASDTVSVFPKTESFIDDTGKSMQRNGDFLYSYYDGRLMRTQKEDGETSLLYQTSPNSRLRFCFYGEFIYFVERKGYDSPDNRDTILCRMEKDGSNLTLLQDNILNAAPLRFITYFRERKYNVNEYDIDIYDDIIYLLNYTYNPQEEENSTKNSNVYFKLEKDGSVSQIAEEDTLYGSLPEGFSAVSFVDPSQPDFPSLPYFMRNYGYLFVKDVHNTLWRIDPAGGLRENLSVMTTDLFTNFVFSGDSILLYSSSGGGLLLLSLSDKTMTPLNSFSLYDTINCRVFSAEEGFYYCQTYRSDFPAGEGSYYFVEGSILSDSSRNILLNYEFFEENKSDFAAIQYDSCPFGNYVYYFKEEEAKHSLMQLSPSTGEPESTAAHKTSWSATDKVSWSIYPASSPADLILEEREEKIEPGNACCISCSTKKLSLAEQTGADKLINQYLEREAYRDFEAHIEDTIQNEQILLARYPNYYEQYDEPYSIDFSLTTTCEYMDDDTISFCCAYYEYFSDTVHGSHWRHYFTFDRHTGRRLSFEDFVADTDLILAVAAPYVENKAEWGFSPKSVLEPDRFSLSADGYMVHFSPYEIGPYAAGHISVTIPYEAFGKTQ